MKVVIDQEAREVQVCFCDVHAVFRSVVDSFVILLLFHLLKCETLLLFLLCRLKILCFLTVVWF